ncbi:MAG: TIGR03084 family protein [Acidimicrobiales bacterium]|nr:TIGR03084 family protein [Acidimicrobiales bacterium]
MHELLRDLADEHADLDRIVAGIGPADWDRPTPAEGWAVRDQISHLAFFDGTATLAVADPEQFASGLEALRDAEDASAYLDQAVARGRVMDPADLLRWWRAERRALLAAARGLDPRSRLPWYGPPMSAMSFLSARLMETWAHGQDVVDALGARRAPTLRLRHVAQIGVRARPWSYVVRGLESPTGEVHVDLAGPGGERWTWGDPAAPDTIRGPALDFCLVAVQRRHPADTALVADGALAEEWLAIAQAFAGGPGAGRRPGQFAPG